MKPWLIVAALAVAASACTGDDDDDTNTATPLDVAITDMYTASGTANVIPGECVGFRMTEANSQFTEDTQIRLTDSTGADIFAAPFTSVNAASGITVLVISSNGDSLTMGRGADYPCVVFPFDMPAISANAVVEEGALSDEVTNVFTWGTLPILNLGTSSGAVSDTIPTGLDFDVWAFKAGQNNAVLALTGTTNAGGVFLPYQETMLGSDFGDSTPGFDVVIRPVGAVAGVQYAHAVRPFFVDSTTAGGFSYDLTLSSSGFPTMALTVAHDTCDATLTPLVATPAYFTANSNTTGIDGDYDPAGAAGCANAFYSHPDIGGPQAGDGVDAPGKDFVVRVNVPAGQTLVAGAQGDTVDVSFYVMTSAAACVAQTACLAAVDYNGSMTSTAPGTDSLHWTNTGATQDVFLVIDDFDAAAGGDVKVFVDVR